MICQGLFSLITFKQASHITDSTCFIDLHALAPILSKKPSMIQHFCP